jgi:AraC-like DNA-binding protein
VDVLSDAVTAMRTGEPHSRRARLAGPFARRFPAVTGAGFHVVLQGSAWLYPSSGESGGAASGPGEPGGGRSSGGEPIELRVGDVAFLPRGSAHGLADDPATPLPHQPSDLPLSDGTEPPPGSAATVLLCGAYLLERSRAHPVLDELPELVLLRAGVGRHPGLRTAVDLLGAELMGPETMGPLSAGSAPTGSAPASSGVANTGPAGTGPTATRPANPGPTSTGLARPPRPGADAMLTALLDVLLLHILRAWLDDRAAGGRPTGWAAALADPPVAAALRAIHADPARAWTVAELGAHGGLSRSAFARRFGALVGQPPLTYLTWWRMTLAARRLRADDAPVAVVARGVGYGSEFAFGAAFKREFGTPPGAYRRTAPTV